MQNSYEKRSKLHYSEKKVDSVEKLSKKMEYYDKLFNQFESKFTKPDSTNKKPLPQDFSLNKKRTKEEFSPRLPVSDPIDSIGDVTTRLKQFEIKISDQKDVNTERFEGIEKELKEINKRLKELELNGRPSSFEAKFEERLARLEDKSEWLNSRLIDEKQLQMRIEGFERMRKNSRDNKNLAGFQEDILNEINNLYSLLRKSLNNQRDMYLESQNIKKKVETEISIAKISRYEQKSPRLGEKLSKSPRKYEQKSPRKYEQRSPRKYEQRSPKVYQRKSPWKYEEKKEDQKSPREVFEESKRKIYQEMRKDRSFSTGTKLKTLEDEVKEPQTRGGINNEVEDLKYMNYTTKLRDSLENNNNNQGDIEKLKLEEYQRRNDDLREKYMGHERMHSTQTDYKKFDRGDLNVDDIEKRRKIDEEINKRLNMENEKRDKFIGNLENKRKILEKKEEFNQKRDKFKFSPFSTEKSRNQELASRLGLEKKLKEEKIDKLTDSLNKYK